MESALDCIGVGAGPYGVDFLSRQGLLAALARYLNLDQIARLTAWNVTEIDARLHGPDVRLYLRRFGLPDVQMPREIWHAWLSAALESRAYGSVLVFTADELEGARKTAGIALSDLEPDLRHPRPREGVMEIQTVLSDFGDRIDQICSEVIQSCEGSTGLWDENTITGFILDRLTKELGTTDVMLPNGNQFQFTFRGYKRKPPVETEKGDVTFIVIRENSDGSAFMGVGYLEAKRRVGDDFPAFDQMQLMRILMSARHGLVGLYDPEAARYGECVQVSKWPTRMAVLPMEQVPLSSKKLLNGLCKYSTTLGFQIAVRFLNGADLALGKDLSGGILGALRSEYIATITAGDRRRLEEKLRSNPAVERTLADFDDIEKVIDNLRSQAEQRSKGR